MAELIWLQDRKVFERYCFVQVLAQLACRGVEPSEAVTQAREYAALATASEFATKRGVGFRAEG